MKAIGSRCKVGWVTITYYILHIDLVWLWSETRILHSGKLSLGSLIEYLVNQVLPVHHRFVCKIWNCRHYKLHTSQPEAGGLEYERRVSVQW